MMVQYLFILFILFGSSFLSSANTLSHSATRVHSYSSEDADGSESHKEVYSYSRERYTAFLPANKNTTSTLTIAALSIGKNRDESRNEDFILADGPRRTFGIIDGHGSKGIASRLAHLSSGLSFDICYWWNQFCQKNRTARSPKNLCKTISDVFSGLEGKYSANGHTHGATTSAVVFNDSWMTFVSTGECYGLYAPLVMGPDRTASIRSVDYIDKISPKDEMALLGKPSYTTYALSNAAYVFIASTGFWVELAKAHEKSSADLVREVMAYLKPLESKTPTLDQLQALLQKMYTELCPASFGKDVSMMLIHINPSEPAPHSTLLGWATGTAASLFGR